MCRDSRTVRRAGREKRLSSGIGKTWRSVLRGSVPRAPVVVTFLGLNFRTCLAPLNVAMSPMPETFSMPGGFRAKQTEVYPLTGAEVT